MLRLTLCVLADDAAVVPVMRCADLHQCCGAAQQLVLLVLLQDGMFGQMVAISVSAWDS